MNSSQKVKARLLISQAHDKECYLLEILYDLPLLFRIDMNSCLLVLKGVMVRKGKRKRRFTTCKRRRLNHRTNTDARSWANLPGDMLGMISKQLNFIDNLSFGGVCKSWRSVSVAHKENFLASQPPLIFLIAVYAKRACSLYNIFDKTKYKTMLPNLVGRTCWGFSCGYLILQDKKFKLDAINLITREELHFPVLPEYFKQFFLPEFRTILAYSTMLSEFVLVFVQKPGKLVYFCQAGGEDWTVYSFADKPWVIMDLAVFNGKIYVLTDCAGIGIFKLWPNLTLVFLDVKGTPSLSTPYLQLVILNEELLMLDKMHSDHLTYKLDLTNMEWVRVERLGNAALFVHKNQSAIISNPSKWGGNGSSIYYMDSKRCEKEPRVEYRSAFLYFPHQSQDKNLLQDDISGSD